MIKRRCRGFLTKKISNVKGAITDPFPSALCTCEQFDFYQKLLSTRFMGEGEPVILDLERQHVCASVLCWERCAFPARIPGRGCYSLASPSGTAGAAKVGRIVASRFCCQREWRARGPVGK